MNINELTSFEENVNKHMGKKGTEERTNYDADSLAFQIGVMLVTKRNIIG